MFFLIVPESKPECKREVLCAECILHSAECIVLSDTTRLPNQSLPPGGRWQPEGLTDEECGQKPNWRYNYQTSSEVGYESLVEALTDSFLHLSARIPHPPFGHLPPGGRDGTGGAVEEFSISHAFPACVAAVSKLSSLG